MVTEQDAFNYAQWATLIAACLSVIGVMYTGLKNRQTAEVIAKLNDTFNTQLKQLEHRLTYHRELAKRRFEVYEKLNDLVADLYVGRPNESDPSKVEPATFTDEEISCLHTKLAAFRRHEFYLNNSIQSDVRNFRNRLEVVLLLSDGEHRKSLLRDLVDLAEKIRKQIMQDSKTLYDMDLWMIELPKNTVCTDQDQDVNGDQNMSYSKLLLPRHSREESSSRQPTES